MIWYNLLRNKIMQYFCYITNYACNWLTFRNVNFKIALNLPKKAVELYKSLPNILSSDDPINILY